jgi:hypothetical protein
MGAAGGVADWQRRPPPARCSPMTHERHAAVWLAARPYLRTRKNDVHVPISYHCAERLLRQHPEADAEVVLLGILLHDTGWAEIDEQEIREKAFGPDMRQVLQSDIRRRHEQIGARLAREILTAQGHPQAIIDEVARIIDGHDSRPEALSLNDQLVKDADKAWRFTTTGIAVACDWHKFTPARYVQYLEQDVRPSLFTEAARAFADSELAAARQMLLTDLLA